MQKRLALCDVTTEVQVKQALESENSIIYALVNKKLGKSFKKHSWIQNGMWCAVGIIRVNALNHVIKF